MCHLPRLHLSLALLIGFAPFAYGAPRAQDKPDLPYCISNGEVDANVFRQVHLLPNSKQFISEIPQNTLVQLSTGHKCMTSKRYQTFKVGSGTFPLQIGGNFICPSGFTVTGFSILENIVKK